MLVREGDRVSAFLFVKPEEEGHGNETQIQSSN